MQSHVRSDDDIPHNSPLHFARFEFKYILPLEKRLAVEDELRYFLQFDPFVVNRSGNRYTVRSLYYDDPSYSAFHDKVDGLHSRYKFRIRTYASDPADEVPMFIEIKGRHNNLVFKNRAPVERDGIDWSHLRGSALSRVILERAATDPVVDQFRFDLVRKRLKPVALIDYQRRPYVSKYDPTFRLTFDEQLSARHTDRVFPGATISARKILAGYTVLEVKFRHHLPSWFHRIIQSYELQRVSISKICAGMEILGLAYDER
ncbi:MAG: polyphosphate polymerase domain-containing protein [Gammaproteobacteria bacterium]|nr:polyphosphate polymerase domain-containing protein [Gammaproteobacteria bacterium]